ncbi:PREDICTED: uncharacterized protein LOC101297012 [Fragaria vesca subsp. vesca]
MWRLPSLVEVQARGDRYLFTFASERDVNRFKKGDPWAYLRSMIIINNYDGFSDIRQVPLNFVRVWVEILGLRVALTTAATTRLVGETIGSVLQVDQHGINREIVRVRLTLMLDEPVRLTRRIRVSPTDVLEVQFRYERLWHWCRVCSMLNHGGLPCPREQEAEAPAVIPSLVATPSMVFRANIPSTLSILAYVSLSTLFPKEKRAVTIREVPAFPSPTKITGIR